MKVSPIICVVTTGDICGEAATWSASGNSVYRTYKNWVLSTSLR